MKLGKSFFKIFATILLIFFQTIVFVYAQSENKSVHGKVLSDTIFSQLENQGYNPSKNEFFTGDAPYNIILDFKTNNTHTNSSLSTLYVAFTQDDILYKNQTLLQMLDFIKRSSFDYNISVLLTSGDKPNLPGNEVMSGTELWCYGLEGAENLSALVINFTKSTISSLTPGGGGNVSPFWFTKLVTNSFEKNKMALEIKGGIFLTFYNLNILKNDLRLSSFLTRDIPSIAINFSNETSETQNVEVLENIFTSYSSFEKEEYSKHYVFFKLFGKYSYLTEKTLLIILLVITLISLFALCDFTFILKSFTRVKRKQALKLSYFIPLTIILLTLSFTVGQFFAKLFYTVNESNPFILFSIKLIIGLILISIYFLIELKIHKTVPIFAYEYLLTIASVVNIFLFSAIEISFVLIFVLEYVLIFISRPAKKIIPLYICLTIIALPYLPLLYSFALYTTTEQLQNMIFCNMQSNIILSFAFIPFTIMWIRIMARIHKALKTKRVIPYTPFILASVSLIVEVLAIMISCNYKLNKSIVKNNEVAISKPVIKEMRDAKNLNVNYFETSYYGNKIRHLNIRTSEKAERIEVIVTGESSNPIYYTPLNYGHANTPQSAKFYIPDWPSQNLKIIYTPDASKNSSITVTAFFPDNKNYTKEAKTILISEKQNAEES